MTGTSPVINFILNAVAIGIVFLFGSTGEIITEKSGHLNLGIPGVMCAGAMSGCAAIHVLYDLELPGFLVVTISILASFLGSALLGALYSFLTVNLRANQNVTGLVLTTFGVGLTKFVMSTLSAPHYLYAKKFFRFPFSDYTNSLQYCGVMTFLAIIIAVVASLVLTRTRVGLHLRAVGESPATADAAGINVSGYRYFATMVGCGIAGLGGLYYVMDFSGSQEAYKSIEPLGWLAVALVIFALWRPWVSIFGSIIFGALFILPQSITLFITVSSLRYTTLFKMLPYVITLIILIISSIRNKRENQPPEGLGVNYYREDR
ncbi:MAG: ABC transporter permease [Clostridia bacterium]|nr:ABC transporter permease [Clostridia bacterium]